MPDTKPLQYRQRRAPANAALAFFLLLLVVMPATAVAVEPVGKVISTVGSVTAIDDEGSKRAISRNDVVYAGEAIVTQGPRGRAQIRFEDEGLIDLRAGSRFEIEEYREPEDPDEGGNAVMRLVTGALRAITGRIGQDPEDEYEMETPTATVGIRGTDYSLQYCASDCVGGDRREGLYGRVDSGAVQVSNAQGTRSLEAGSYFFVPPEGAPERSLTPPDGVLDGSADDSPSDQSVTTEGDAIGSSEDGSETDTETTVGTDGGRAGGASDVATAVEFTEADRTVDDEEAKLDGDGGTDPTDPVELEGRFAGALRFLPAEGEEPFEEVFTFDSPSAIDGETLDGETFLSVLVDEEGTVTAIDNFGATEGGRISFAEMTLAERDTTTVDGADVEWGRFSGDVVITDGDGNEFAVSGDHSFGYVNAADITATETLQSMPSLVRYELQAGPDAVASDGGLWSLEALKIEINFSDQFASLNDLNLKERDGGTQLQFTSNEGNLNLDEGRFVFSNAVDQLENGTFDRLEGRFIGDNGKGALAVFGVSDDRDERIQGLGILEDAEVDVTLE